MTVSGKPNKIKWKLMELFQGYRRGPGTRPKYPNTYNNQVENISTIVMLATENSDYPEKHVYINVCV